VETVGQRWVAKRFTHDCTSISNEPSIRQDWDAVRSVPNLYAARNQLVRDYFNPLEESFSLQLPKIISEAVRADETVDSVVLDVFTANCVERVVEAIHSLFKQFER
jgi:hypothetical protein